MMNLKICKHYCILFDLQIVKIMMILAAPGNLGDIVSSHQNFTDIQVANAPSLVQPAYPALFLVP